ncbi:hypothetical protein BDA96_01G021700 [Sorghum bicolor]|uniref:J domain-containing protein n=2 Tax=Sorghum bicolor TaxID=4558 RepID=A0A921UYT5_SORBI|nr:hypothetical protein BDA96_01G021700 [Sorghum bicolor]OQU90664.1 hypothetical protein SORBI_3001G020900 [Sorghum bicolor]
MATGTEKAEKAFRYAEERFLAGDLDGALRVSRNAKRHLASLPALQSALAAYEVHAAARGERNCWYAVLSVGQPETVAHDHDAIKKRYRRLCLVLHPDKNRSAAADGAFKLLQRAWEVLSARHPPGTVPDPGLGTGAKPRPPPAGAPDPDWWSSFFGSSPPAGAPDPDWWSSFFGSSPPPRAPGRDWWSSHFRYKPPPERTWSSYGYTPPPPPFSSASSANFSAWRSSYAREKGTAYCGHCSSEPAAGGGRHGTPGGRCHSCGTAFNPPPPPPRESQAEGASDPPPAGSAAEPPPRRQRDDDDRVKFTCRTECSRCKTTFSSLVSRGLCKLRCQACSYDVFVYGLV